MRVGGMLREGWTSGIVIAPLFLLLLVSRASEF
jgi:hypothetical protein